MKIIAVENGIVVDVFDTLDAEYIRERKDARPDVVWLEDVECSIGQLYDSKTKVFSNKPAPEPEAPTKPKPTQLDRVEMKLDIINLRAEGIL